MMSWSAGAPVLEIDDQARAPQHGVVCRRRPYEIFAEAAIEIIVAACILHDAFPQATRLDAIRPLDPRAPELSFAPMINIKPGLLGFRSKNCAVAVPVTQGDNVRLSRKPQHQRAPYSNLRVLGSSGASIPSPAAPFDDFTPFHEDHAIGDGAQNPSRSYYRHCQISAVFCQFDHGIEDILDHLGSSADAASSKR